MSQERVTSSRLEHQLLGKRKADSAEQVVRSLAALQAQDYESALWAIGVRMKAGIRTEVEAAVASGGIVRSWVLRGTLHFVPGEDLTWMLALSRAATLRKMRLRRAALELDEKTLARCEQALLRALPGKHALPRSEVFEVFERIGVSPLGERGYHVLCYLALHGVVCLAAPEGKQATVARVAAILPKQRALEGDEALAELATRYVASRAPATPQDFAWWSGLSAAQSKRALQAAQVPSNSEKTPAPRKLSSALLLPGFDEYLLGYKERGDVLAPEHAKKVVPGGNGIFLPMLVRNGQVVGLWRRLAKRNSLEISFAPFAKIEAESRAGFERAAASYAHFHGQALTPLWPRHCFARARTRALRP